MTWKFNTRELTEECILYYVAYDLEPRILNSTKFWPIRISYNRLQYCTKQHCSPSLVARPSLTALFTAVEKATKKAARGGLGTKLLFSSS